MANRVKQIIEGGGIALKNNAVPPTPSMVELLGYCGIDLVEFDWDYTPLDIPLIENMARAAELSGVTSLVKFRELDPVAIWDVLDTGVKGVLMPNIKSAEEAKELVDIVRAAPEGRRRKNIWWGRDTRFGTKPYSEWVEGSHDIVIGCEIETVEAVENIEAILAVDGLTYVSLGHTDLAYSLGRYPAATDDPVILEAFEKVVAAARKQDKVKMNVSLGGLGNESGRTPWIVGMSVEDIIADRVVGIITCAPFPHIRVIESLTKDVQAFGALIAKERGTGKR